MNQALGDARLDRLTDLYIDHQAGATLGYGPAAERLSAAFDTVATEAKRLRSTGAARHGDARVERDLLRQADISIRFGTLNHCLLNERHPVGAKCLEAAVTLPEGHRGPLLERCQPGRCSNSMIAPEHLPPWQAERDSLLTVLQDDKLPSAQRGALQRQLTDVDAVIERAAAS